MKILYFYQYFSTLKGSWGTRVYEFGSDWVKEGHQLTVVTCLYSKSDLKAKKFIEDQFFNGIHVKVINIKLNNKDKTIKRIWTFIIYCLISSWYAIKLKADVVIASSGPITVGIPGLIARYVRNRKLIFEVRDIWPQGAIELGVIKNKLLIYLSYWLEERCYRASSHIITLSPGMKSYIFERFKLTNITSVTNSANFDLFGIKVNNPVLPDFFTTHKVAIYYGNIGLVNNSILLIKAARLLKEMGINDIIILLIGDGKEKDCLLNEASRQSLDNFKIFPLMSKTELVQLVQNSFISIVPLKGTPILDTSSPNKLFESLASGIPVIQNTKGWISDMLKDNNLGFTVDADDPKELVEKLIYLKDNTNIYNTMCNNCKSYALKNFDKTVLAKRMLNAILS
jgi:glycosyltransferase involved in cell wall biosynthesis